MSVYRIYVEKKKPFAVEASGILADIHNSLGISHVEDVRVINRYDVEDIEEGLFTYAKTTVFSEPQLDIVSDEADLNGAAAVFAVEPLPGQFDQRADSAAQCIQLLGQCDRPTVHSAKVYALYGDLTTEDVAAIKKHVINPVECREASLDKPETLKWNISSRRRWRRSPALWALTVTALPLSWTSWALPWTWTT